jgi:hypothetical protein
MDDGVFDLASGFRTSITCSNLCIILRFVLTQIFDEELQRLRVAGETLVHGCAVSGMGRWGM